MDLTEKVLTALKLCQILECEECPYLNEVKDCQFQLLAKDAEAVIAALQAQIALQSF